MTSDRWIACAAIWLALACDAMAHPPYVEPWTRVANLSIAGMAAVCTAVLVRKKFGLAAAVVAGVVAGLICGFAGIVISIVASM